MPYDAAFDDRIGIGILFGFMIGLETKLIRFALEILFGISDISTGFNDDV